LKSKLDGFSPWCASHVRLVSIKPHMKLESAIRILAGTLVLSSLALAHWVDPRWLLLAAFVGFNLIQSAITGFCPAELILTKLGVGCGGCSSTAKTAGERTTPQG
jgi:hypothetical protein